MILFQSQIEEHQKLAEHYRELAAKREALVESLLTFQQQADSDLSSLRLLVDKCKEVAPNAIASLKSAVLNLFDGGDDGNDGGNQSTDPTPDTDPTDPDDDEFELLCLNGETGDYLTTDDLAELESQEAAQTEDDGDSEVSSSTKLTYAQAIKRRCSACWGYEVTSRTDIKAGFINRTDLNFMEAVNLERTGKEFYQTVEAYLDRLYYNGQSCPLEECPDSSRTGQHYQLTSLLTSLLWEDAPLLSQHCMVAFQDAEDKDTTDVEAKPFVELVMVSDAIAYQRKHDGEIACVYVGFNNKAIAKSWMRFLEPMTAERIELRPSQRLQAFKWELKIKGISMQQIERLSQQDLDQTHRPEIDSAKPSSFKPRSTPQPVNPADVGEGDIVTTLFTPGSSYRIKAVKDDGILDCENLVTGTRLGLRATSVTLLEKAATAPQPPEAPQPKVDSSRLHAKILLKESEYVGQVLPVSRVSPNEMGYTVTLPDGQSRWFKADLVQILDAEIEEKALPSEPAEPEVIDFNDLVEVVADGNDAVGLIGSVGRVKILGVGDSEALLRSADRVGVEIDEQLVYFDRSELKVRAKGAIQLSLLRNSQPVGYAPELALCGADDASDF